jgi:formylglycine-generating enzyme required for sulfatase activity
MHVGSPSRDAVAARSNRLRRGAVAAFAALMVTAVCAEAQTQGQPQTQPQARTLAQTSTPAPTAKGAPAAAPTVAGAFRDCPTCPELVIVPAGEFTLGTSIDDPEADVARGESPPLAITMTRAYAIGRTEVTVAQFRAFVAATQYASLGECRHVDRGGWSAERTRDWQNPGFPQQPDEPVVCVSWDDAKAYVDWLAKSTGKAYRLPSETEWEYAARGGTTTPRYWGSRDSQEGEPLSLACDNANVYDASAVATLALDVPNANCSDKRTYTSPVGSFKSNAFDLVDAIGNAREWLQDCYTTSYRGRPQDGRAWEWGGGCELRGVRGGSWATRPSQSRSAARGAEPQGQRQSDLGFRVARDL